MTVEIPPAPEGAHRFFGGRLARAEAFVAILADTGVSHGLIGPREVPILWERHVLNCAVVEDAFAADSRLIDVGSGAGLPGIGVAIVRPDLDVHLVEPMLRRTEWLSSTVEQLGLGNVTVHRGRAEEFHGQLSAPYVTARAVARLDKLARWCLPLVEHGGSMVAMKGRSAPEELTAATKVLRRLGVTHSQVSTHGADVLSEPTLTVDCSKSSRSS
ncbi:MAG: 16S rRNA (guanine(527)-N(7))-methyltransferase RsmG [Janibacter sp.]|nr:16S rRNA (guanine(527)-N(7))-methyltransferase RsmG [Janibacter sp.]